MIFEKKLKKQFHAKLESGVLAVVEPKSTIPVRISEQNKTPFLPVLSSTNNPAMIAPGNPIIATIKVFL